MSSTLFRYKCEVKNYMLHNKTEGIFKDEMDVVSDACL